MIPLLIHSDPSPLAKGLLSLTLTLSNLTIWYAGQTPQFLLLLGKVALAFLPTALFVALRPLFSFWQAQYVFPLKPAPFCKLSSGLGSTNNFATSLLFSSSLTLALSLPPCPLFRLSFYHNLFGRNCLLSPLVLSNYNGFPDTLFSWGTTLLTS